MKTVLYVCVHNAGRSQMAEAFTNYLASQQGLQVQALSAGTEAGTDINPVAREVMEELGISMAGHQPKQITIEMVQNSDRVITMGCGVDADTCPALLYRGVKNIDDWGLDDPKGQPIETVRIIRDQVKTRVEQLLAELCAE